MGREENLSQRENSIPQQESWSFWLSGEVINTFPLIFSHKNGTIFDSLGNTPRKKGHIVSDRKTIELTTISTQMKISYSMSQYLM